MILQIIYLITSMKPGCYEVRKKFEGVERDRINPAATACGNRSISNV